MKHLLGENKLAYFEINYVDTKRISQEDFDSIVALDVTQTKRYTEWIINQFITNPGIASSFGQLGQAIKASVKFPDQVKEIKFKDMSVDEFIKAVKTNVSAHVKPQVKKQLVDNLSQYKVGTVLGHTIYVIKKGALEVDGIFNNLPNISTDIVEYGDVIYVGSNDSKRYVISFAADIYVDETGNPIPIKSQNVDLWDNIFAWLYTKNYVQEDIIACIDLFGEFYDKSKLAKAIATHNPKTVFSKYYSNESNKLTNLIINTNSKSISDYSKYIETFKNLGFGLKGILMNVDLGSPDIAEIKSSINEEEYEEKVKAHFKRTSQSFDKTTFSKIKEVFNNNGTLYFLILRDTDPTNGIFLESGNNIIGFVDRKELSHVLTKFHSARKAKSILDMISPQDEKKRGEYERELTNIQNDIKKIIDYSKSLKHYIIGA